MKKLLVDDLYEIADFMYEKATDGCMTSFVGLYDDIVWVIKALLEFEDVCIFDIEINSYEMSGYDKEYLVTLTDEMNVWCEKTYEVDSGEYIYYETGCLLIADDCNKEVLSDAYVDDAYLVSYDFDENDELECDGNCDCCEYANQGELNENSEELVDESKNEYTHISKTKDGKLAGFSKSWSDTDKDGFTHYSSFSHYGTNEDTVKKIARDFGINV